MREGRRHTAWLPGLVPVLALLQACPAKAQCTTTITTFPYTEGFEGGAAWTSGGANADWAWGSPVHPTIDHAASGTNAWCVGGLSGSFYSNGQQSWVESPCFDLSGLAYPWLSFRIWWETEYNYDGVGLQYSPNGGTTWINVGAFNDPADCHTTNWFNSQNITALNLASPRSGWSGTSTTGGCASGGGSNGWVTAAHCLTDLPTATPVKFRFIFGAGTVCNTFDGVAIDEFHIGEAPPLDPAFVHTCSGNTVNFNATGMAGCVEQGTWSFGDPASGAANTATGATAAHTYPGPGTYTVSFTMSSSCSAPVTVQHAVTIAELDLEVTDVGCVPNTGAITAAVTGAPVGLTFDWSPGGADTQTITGLAPGSYTVLVQAPGMCPLQASATVGTDAATITASVAHTDISCQGAADGTASVSASGGSGVYTYVWSPSGGTAAIASGLAAGPYTCTIADDAGCSTEVNVTILEPTDVVATADPGAAVCAGQSTTLVGAAVGGTGPYTYAWSPAGPVVSPFTTTTYTLIATDANGCTSDPVQTTVTVTAAFQPDLLWDVNEGCAPLCVTFTDASPVAGTRSWTFGDGGTAGDMSSPTYCYPTAGAFDVTLSIVTAEGCSASRTVDDLITVHPTPHADPGASPVVAMIDDPTFHFTDRGAGATAYTWSFGDPTGATSTLPAPAFSYPEVGCFTVTLTTSNDHGCVDTATLNVCVEDEFALFAPNGFSPNGDGINDVFNVRTTVSDPKAFSLVIHDRWGRVVYTTHDPHQGWDGSEVPLGVYIWQVSIDDRTGDHQQRTGHVTLLR